MQNFIRLRKSGSRWEFESETELEDFVWANLQQLLSLIPLKRQYRVNGQICDIVAVDENKQLVVIELKNGEDRYIVQQLTRYYDALLEEKAFDEKIDYEQSVRLVAIAPNFHKDNLTDKRYHQLFFQLLQFNLIQTEDKFYFFLKDIDTNKVLKIDFFSQGDSTSNILSPPKALLKLLSECNSDEREAVLRIREKILKFDSRMQELINNGSINYGKGKSNSCAELCFDMKRNCIALFLWLPHVYTRQKKRFIARMRVWTNWKIVSDIGHVPKGTGRMINKDEWKLGIVRPLSKLLPRTSENKERYFNEQGYRDYVVSTYHIYYKNKPSYKSGLAMELSFYMKLIGKIEESNSLNTFIDMALETWLERI